MASLNGLKVVVILTLVTYTVSTYTGPCDCKWGLTVGKFDTLVHGGEGKNYGSLNDKQCCSKLMNDCIYESMIWAKNASLSDSGNMWFLSRACSLVAKPVSSSDEGNEVNLIVQSGRSCFKGGHGSFYVKVADKTREFCCKKSGYDWVYDTSCTWH